MGHSFEETLGLSTHESLTRIRGPVPMIRFISKMVSEMVQGLFRFRNTPATVTIYGSARIKPDDPYYQMAEKLGQELAKRGIPVITGGGPGIMEAANKGAFSQGDHSNGCNIILPFEQKQNPYLSCSYQTEFFFVRKFLLRHSSKALIAFPGGFGTMDELFESLTLIRTNCSPRIPTVLVGIDYWKGLIDYLTNTQLKYGTISQTDLDQLHLTDDLEEVIHLIEAKHDS